MDKKWMILFSVFSVCTLVISAISCSLIILNEKTHTKINSETILAEKKEYKSTTIIYNQNNTLKLSELNPGDFRSYSFEVLNNNSNTITYSVVWQNVTSNWNAVSEGYSNTHPEEFVYSISCSDGSKIENQKMPYTGEDKEILKDLELRTNSSNSCTLNINFLHKDTDQSYNLNKSFSGTYKVVVNK